MFQLIACAAKNRFFKKSDEYFDLVEGFSQNLNHSNIFEVVNQRNDKGQGAGLL